jgi:SAM-dependent methyltransferase
MAAAPAVGVARVSNSASAGPGVGLSGLDSPRVTLAVASASTDRENAEHEREPYPTDAMENLTAAELVRYSVVLGGRALIRGGGRESAWRIWMPLDIDRVVELPWTGRLVTAAAPTRVLDVASPKLLAVWLAEHTRAIVVATDLWSTEIKRWRRLVRAADPAGDRYNGLELETADGTALGYEDESFDVAYSVSVIEHIPGAGDSKAMTELARVLRPGGLLVLTFPYRKQLEETWVEHDVYGERYEGEPLFFCRHYSAEAVQDRLLGDGAFEVVKQVLWRKAGVPEAQARAHKVIPPGWPVGQLLGPVLPILGKRAMHVGSVDDPGPDNVLGLALRRR